MTPARESTGMKRAWKVVLVLLAALLVLAGGAVAFVSYRSAESLVHPARQATTHTPADVGLAYERVAFASADGIPLVGWWMPADTANGTVIVLHGYGESKNQSLAYAPFLHRAGYNVLAFDFRAHGESGGDHTTVGIDEVKDVEAAWAWLRSRADVDASRVALMGFSMGAATAINAAGSVPARAVVDDSGFATLENIASNSITHFTHLPKYPFGPLAVLFASHMVHEDISINQPVRSVHALHAPVLVIQGATDDIAFPDADGKAVFAAAPAGSQWLLAPGASHVGAHKVDPAGYESRVIAFLDANVARAP
jgi:alpha-beta hydrolase superfamily lysophospholipase